MLEPILQAAHQGWSLVFTWPNILYPFAGTLLAMLFSLLPGLTGAVLMALAIPFTLHWEPLPIILIFGSFVGGATFMGSVTAILFNIPGRNSNAATLLDGHPMAQKGLAKTAIGCSASASALGSTFGIAVLIVLIPFMREAVLSFGPAELLMMAICGLTLLSVLTRGTVIKGLSLASLGILFSFIGRDPRTAEVRYTFGTLYLQDGLSTITIFLGIFALAEVLHLVLSGRPTISGKFSLDELSGSVWDGILSVFRHFGLFIRSSIIGTVVGIIPGVGATVASFVAYGQAAHTVKKGRENFGHGDIRGVLAPEAANDAKDGGSLVPTLAFGIPGGTGTTVLLGALTLHGLTPGREMLGNHLGLTFALVWSLFFSNWLTSILGLAMVNPLARLTTVRTQLLVPFILLLATVGAYIHRGRIEDVAVAYCLGVAGYFMKKHGWPRIPFVIGFVLGPMFENNLHITLRLHQLNRINFWERPIVLALLILTVATLLLPYLKAWKTGGKGA